MSEEKMVDVEVDFTDEEFLKLAKWAHEEDITFNQLIQKALQAAIDRELAKEKENGTSND